MARTAIVVLVALAAFPGKLFSQTAVISQPGLPSFAQPPLPTGGLAGGVADLALQGYYLGGNLQPLTTLTGAATAFREFMPGLGLLSGNIEAYEQNTRGRVGENFVQLRGFIWKGRRWNFIGGDFRLPATAVTFPFQNYFMPFAGIRGGEAEMQDGHTTYTLFAGEETLAAGPRISYRIQVPQYAAGASIRHTIGHLELGARYLHLSSPDDAFQVYPVFFPVGHEFRQVDSLNLGAFYVLSPKLRFYSDATLSHVSFLPGFAAAPSAPLSFLDGVIYDTRIITVRANYGQQSTSYLPLLGYYAGDRRGPYIDVRLHLTKFFEITAAGAITRNNLEHNALATDLRAESASGGAALSLPWKINLSGQYSLIDLRTIQPDPAPGTPGTQKFRNAESTATLARPFGHHSVRLTVRDLNLAATIFNQKQAVAEVEDAVNYSHFTAATAVRFQQVNAGQLQNSVFVRGTLQVRFRHFTAYAQGEVGNDLVNKSVFATNNVNTTVAGVTYSGFKGWNFMAEVFRNSLTSQLNPVSVFALTSQGVGVDTLLSDLNQWSAYIRISKRFQWGAPLPEATDQFTLDQLPLIGSLEGFVKLAGPEALEGVSEVPVVLDGGRTTLSDVSGRYRFEEVPEGLHRVEISKLELPAEYEPGRHFSTEVSIRSRKLTRSDLDVALLDSAIHGVVEGGAKDPDVTGIVITLSPGNRMTTCDQGGQFNFFNLPAGEYEAAVDEKTLPENFVLVPPGPIQVTTTKDKTPEVTFTIEKHEPQLPIRKVFGARSDAIQ
jgi:hypothetical protein